MALYILTGGITLFRRCRCLVIVCLTLAGCQKQYPDEKAVYPIGGVLLVDGAPHKDIQITLHDDAGLDVEKPTFPSGFTDADGKLVISTYASGDGAPAGDYRLTFFWGKVNPISMSYGGPDKLKGRYSDAEKSQIFLRVSEDGKNDLGVVELTTR